MRALLDASSESVMLLAPDGHILAINAFAANRFGALPNTITGKNFFELLPPDLAESRRTLVRKVVNTGQSVHARDRRGAIFFNNSLYPVKDESDAVESIAVYAKDITEQHYAKAVDDILSHMENVLLKWRMGLAAIAQLFCDDILPVFDLSAAWIGRAEEDGCVSLLANADGSRSGLAAAEYLHGLRWQGESACCLPMGAVLATRAYQVVCFDDAACQSCHKLGYATGARCAIVLPLTVRGKTWGVVTLYGRDAHQFNGDQLQARLAAIASRLGGSLESALQQEWLSLLETALAGVGSAVYIANASARILWANEALALLTGFESKDILGETPQVFSSGVHDADFYKQFWQTIQSGVTWRGEVVHVRRGGGRYTVSQTVTPLLDSHGEVSHYVTILEDITRRKSEEERLQHSAQFDLLTDLPNRSLFYDRLEQALALWRREGLSGALLFLDLDHFKEVNDQLGHAAGDELLVAVARRLREQVRESDTVARLGGDEFTVLLPSLRDRHACIPVAQKIINALSQTFPIANRSVTIGVSIGIAFFDEQGDAVESILNAADNAMYLAKRAGRNCYVFATAKPSETTTF
jgi:diguanylate cyclase (GGDEF)-like protein/PAS domain S-box-containing protein